MRTNIAKKPYILVICQGVGGWVHFPESHNPYTAGMIIIRNSCLFKLQHMAFKIAKSTDPDEMSRPGYSLLSGVLYILERWDSRILNVTHSQTGPQEMYAFSYEVQIV